MADGRHNVTASFVFCMDAGIARAWNDLEYGVDYIPFWSKAVGWIGPEPPEFIVANGGASRTVLHTHDEARELYDEVCASGELGGTKSLNLNTDLIKIIVVAKIDADGQSKDFNVLKASIENFNLMNAGSHPNLTYEVLILIFQDERPVEGTRTKAEEIRQLLKGRTGNNPPKIFLSTTLNEDNRSCGFADLDDMAACTLHFAVEQNSWKSDEVEKAGFLAQPQRGRYSEVSTLGLRGFFWERVRAIDISRKENFRNFANKWMEGDGWRVVGEKYPPEWPDNIDAWRRLLWAEMKEVWQDRDNLPTSDTLEEEVVKVVGEVNRELDSQLKSQLRVGGANKESQDKIVRRSLNLISIITKKRINDQFEVLPDAIKQVKRQIRQSFDEWQIDLLRKGVGLSVLRRHYATSIKSINKIEVETHKQDTNYDNSKIMRLAKDTAEALVKIPAPESSFFSTITIFSFLLCLSYYLSQIIFGYGILTSLLISTGLSLVISVSIIYFYLKKQSDIHNSLLKDFNNAVTNMTESLMRHRLNCALEEIVGGTDDEPGAKQLMMEQEKALLEAVEAGKRDLAIFKEEVRIPDPIKTKFFRSENPVKTSYATSWNEDTEKKTEQWAEGYWRNQTFNGNLRDNFISLWQTMSGDHRKFLLEEQEGFNLGVNVIINNEWDTLKQRTFKVIPRQAPINETLVKRQHRRDSYQIYAPSQCKSHIVKHVEAFGKPVSYQGVQNENSICIFNFTDGLEWPALISPAIPEIYILKLGETSEQALERGKLDLHEVRNKLRNGDFSSTECFLWTFLMLSGGRTGDIKPEGRGTNTIVLPNHGLGMGQKVQLCAERGGVKEGEYFVRVEDGDDNTFKLYETLVNAHDGHTVGAVVLSAAEDISFAILGDASIRESEGVHQKIQQWVYLHELHESHFALYYFPSLNKDLASALSNAVQQAKTRSGATDVKTLPPAPPPPSSLTKEARTTAEEEIAKGKDAEIQQYHIDEIFKESVRLGGMGEEEYGAEFTNCLKIVGSALSTENTNSFIKQMGDLAGDGKISEDQRAQIKNISAGLAKKNETKSDYSNKDVIQAQSDLFYTVALYDHDGFTDSEKKKVSHYLKYWVSQL